MRWMVNARAYLPRKKTLYPLYRRLGETQDLFERMRKIFSQPEFDPRTAQSVA